MMVVLCTSSASSLLFQMAILGLSPSPVAQSRQICEGFIREWSVPQH
uniref:Uncharacterized protein n=1 Tax=Rhizophora mucronata TaxID=61149 RepID=A0A2P2K5G4_RHIMU